MTRDSGKHCVQQEGIAVRGRRSAQPVDRDIPLENGRSYRREYVDGVPTGPLETIGRDDHADGCRVVFELDRE